METAKNIIYVDGTPFMSWDSEKYSKLSTFLFRLTILVRSDNEIESVTLDKETLISLTELAGEAGESDFVKKFAELVTLSETSQITYNLG